MLLPSPSPKAALPLPPLPRNKVKTTLGQKVARTAPFPNPTTALPLPTSALSPARTGAGGGIQDRDQGQNKPWIRIRTSLQTSEQLELKEQ